VLSILVVLAELQGHHELTELAVSKMASSRFSSNGARRAAQGLRNGVGIFEVERNRGTSVQIVQEYCGKATPPVSAIRLGDYGPTQDDLSNAKLALSRLGWVVVLCCEAA
jgi:hypothetical protein